MSLIVPAWASLGAPLEAFRGAAFDWTGFFCFLLWLIAGAVP